MGDSPDSPQARRLLAVALVAVVVVVSAAVAAASSLSPQAQAPSPAPAASAATPSAAPTSAPPAPSPSGPPPSRRFGVVAHLLWGDDAAAVQTLDQLAAAGLGVVRFDVSWQHMEPSPGQLDGVDRLDRLMAEIAARRMRPIITVIETPGWANGNQGPFVPPTDPGTYARFVAGLAARYAAVTSVAWEVWNEPNDARFWQPKPDAAAYTVLLQRTAAAIRAAAPGATVLGGSILYGDAGFLSAMYAAGAKGSFDGLAVHPYAQDRAPLDVGDPYHSFAGGLDRLRAVMRANGQGDVPFWITEMGWTTATGLVDAQRADYFREAVAFVAGHPDIEVFAAYAFGPGADSGYVIAPSGTGSASFDAYRAAVAALGPAP